MKKFERSQSGFTLVEIMIVLAIIGLIVSIAIPAFLKNEHFGSIMGEVPFAEVWPQLWVINDLDHDRAKQLIDADIAAAESPTEPWKCGKCGEENEGQFSACWNCGAAAPA